MNTWRRFKIHFHFILKISTRYSSGSIVYFVERCTPCLLVAAVLYGCCIMCAISHTTQNWHWKLIQSERCWRHFSQCFIFHLAVLRLLGSKLSKKKHMESNFFNCCIFLLNTFIRIPLFRINPTGKHQYVTLLNEYYLTISTILARSYNTFAGSPYKYYIQIFPWTLERR